MIKTTKILLLVALVILIGYDIYVFAKKDFTATISAFVWDKSEKYPILPFSIGVICGHFFWQRREDV